MTGVPPEEGTEHVGRPPWRALAVLGVAQVLVVLGWYLVEVRRDADEPVARKIATVVAAERTVRLDRAVPALELERRDGSTFALAAVVHERPVLLHFWATWCPPCIEELPSLLAWAEQGEVEVIAASLDRDWRSVERLLGARLAPGVVRARAEGVSATLGVAGLPVTFVIDPSARVRLRLDGPRDWTSRSLRAEVLARGR